MDLIILPGNSKQYNEQWLKDTAKSFADKFENVITHVFEHWKKEGEEINLDLESQKLLEEVKDKTNYVIYAKSVGTITAIKTIAEHNITPKACVFVGCPFGEYAQELGEFKNWLKKYDVHTLFIQQTDDPFFKYLDLEKFIEDNEIKNYELIEIVGDNHAYDNYKEIGQFMLEFLS